MNGFDRRYWIAFDEHQAGTILLPIGSTTTTPGRPLRFTDRLREDMERAGSKADITDVLFVPPHCMVTERVYQLIADFERTGLPCDPTI